MKALFALALSVASPGLAAEGIFVWNDPDQMAIRMITFERSDPAAVTGVQVLAELTAISATMTAVAADGKGIGLCRQEQDENEAPAWLFGYDRRGKQLWRQNAGDYIDALGQALPEGLKPYHYNAPSWFTFTCKDAGASGEPGVLAFDVGFSAGKPDGEGFVISDDAQDFIGRLHVEARTGKVLAAALVQDGASALVLQQNPRQQIYTDDAGQTYMLGTDAAIVLPKGGRGRVMWGERPFRWQGAPIVEGYDFAWYLPPRD